MCDVNGSFEKALSKKGLQYGRLKVRARIELRAGEES
jgi:hypothetical protein